MKQHITIEQLEGLSSKAERKLRTWARKRANDKNWLLVPRGHERLWLNIGQMIEFLGDHNDTWTYYTVLDWKKRVVLGNSLLCDVLWEAVKEVLESK